MTKIALLVFDCDGVILDSAGIKVDAFNAVGSHFVPEIGEWLVRAHKGSPGLSRHLLFERLYRVWFGREITESERQQLNAIFRAFCRERMLAVRPIPGALETVRKWRSLLPVYVCSGTPHEDLLALFNERKLTELFTGVFGSPPIKNRLLANIVRKAHVLPEETLMIGDSITDLEAARMVGTQFYGCGEKMASRVANGGRDLCGLDAWLTQQTGILANG